jgi:branched-subunit amino acid aminotransferase/4-amino-4-deoxychorismate lyase
LPCRAWGAGCKFQDMKNYAKPSILSADQAVQKLKERPRPWAEGEYLAMFSSHLGGIVTEPWLMSVPIDDHMVHRGDGVFEATKCIAGRIYQFRQHLERLARSAASIQLELPLTRNELESLAVAVVRAGGEPDCMVRIYVSRGPGGFTTNPFECPEAGLYVVVSKLHSLPSKAYEMGVQIGISQVPSKSGFFASVKSCNYLPNVLLKREAVMRGWDFAIGLDERGQIAEGSTENIGLVGAGGALCLPLPENILEGTTARRAQELAQEMVAEGLLKGFEHCTISVAELRKASEVMLFGTTLDVLPVTRLEGEPIGGGKPGPVAKELLARMRKDVLDNYEMSTPALV